MISVLYVDDEKDLLLLGKNFLELDGSFSVSTISSATEALSLLQTRQFDAIISDYQMPGMDGIQFLKQVRKHHGTIPFILFTGRGREEVVIQALNEGADYYLQKGGDTVSQYAELSHKVTLAVQKRQAEAALEASEERYRAVVEDQTELICRFMPDGRLVFVNEAYCRYYEVGKDECIGRPYSTYLLPDEKVWMEHHLAGLTRESPFISVECRVRIKDGSSRWHTWNIRAIFNAEGQVAEYQVVGQDITQQRKTEEKLRESENLFVAFMNNLPASAFMKDAQGQYLYANPMVKENLGDIVVIGRSDSDLFPPDNAKKARDTDQKVLLDGFIIYFESIQLQDGTLHFFETHKFRIDREGKPPIIGGFAMDISDRKQAEDALIRSEEQSRILIDHIQDGAFLSQDGILLLCNEALASMIGYTKDELSGISISDIIAPPDRDLVISRHMKRLAGESFSETYEFRMLHRDGRTFIPIRISVGAGSYQGSPAVIGTIHNLVHDLEQESALRESEERYRNMYNNVQIGLFVSTPDGRFLSANPHAVTHLGYDSEEDFIQSIPDIAQVYADPKDRDEAFRLLQSKGFFENFETRFYKKDGSIIWGSITAKIVTDKQGNTVVEGTCLDINDRKLTELALKESEQRLSWIYSSGIFGIIFWDIDGTITDANDAFLEMLGYSRDDLKAGLINGFSLTPPEYASVDTAAIAELMESGVHKKPYQKEYFKKDGTRIPVILAGALLDENRTHGVGFVIDLSDCNR